MINFSLLVGFLQRLYINPSLFARRFPYLLPNVVGATLALLAVPLVLGFFPETLVSASSGET